MAIPRGRSLPVMTNGINTKTDLDLIIAKEASRRGLKLSDLESRTTLKGNNTTLDAPPSVPSKKTSEDHNLNELDKLSVEGGQKSVKGGQQNRAASFGVFAKSSKKSAAKGNEKLKDYEEEDDDNEESDSDSLSASSSSINNSRKNSRSSSPKVRLVLCLFKDGAYQYRGSFVQFMTVREKQILARAIGIQKKTLR